MQNWELVLKCLTRCIRQHQGMWSATDWATLLVSPPLSKTESAHPQAHSPSTSRSAQRWWHLSAWGLTSSNPDPECHLENLEMFVLQRFFKKNSNALPSNTLWSKWSVSETWKTGRGTSRNHFPTNTHKLEIPGDFKMQDHTRRWRRRLSRQSSK